jgi:hypothetical protein
MNTYTGQFYANFSEPTFDDGRISVTFEVHLVEILIVSGGENVNVGRQGVELHELYHSSPEVIL